MAIDWEERITIDSSVLSGKPVVKGTRLAVEFVIELLAEGWVEADIIKNYPRLTPEDIRACLAYAHDRLQEEITYPLQAG